MSRYFTYLNSTLSAPDHINLADFPMLTPDDEVGWAWYLSQVKTNMLTRPLQTEEIDTDDNIQKFWHAKFYGKAYMAIDRIGGHRGV